MSCMFHLCKVFSGETGQLADPGPASRRARSIKAELQGSESYTFVRLSSVFVLEQLELICES